ncbi:hypothetical protein GCM10025857_11830 [Alicyclobacillus contaminans]|uniref:endolytic transglycosylase MltG n=1 Tax=Alicyclobacillus contaminans TaxID=392016 RepID=UPI00040EAB85|nr:endolytic transglycosylase MltG [Alicyclobacillus contaminans]GMA49826.1 hypothetical protein GCM10025857_11830 [Alicyclobacillus contaminans]
MLAYHVTTHPLLKSVIHRSFSHAIKELGLPDYPEAAFVQELKPFLQSPGSLFEDTEPEHRALWQALHRGEVFATHTRDNGETFVFYVRLALGVRRMDVRLLCRQRQWQLEAVTAMFTAPAWKTPWIRNTALAAAMVCAVLVGYVLHRPGERVVQQPVVIRTAASNAAPAANTTKASNTPSNTTSGATEVRTAKTMTFTLQPGMSLYHLSKYLQSEHLVDNAISFDMLMKKTGVDKDVHPGTYKFRTGMTENEILQVLKQGPAH